MEVRLGKVAYDAYGAERGWVVFDGSPMPHWNKQPSDLQEAWEAAAKAVAQLVANSGEAWRWR